MSMRPRQVMPTEPTENMIQAAYMLIETMPKGTPERHRRIVAEVWRQMCEVAPPAATGGLTRRQQEVHEVIAAYIDDYKISPTYQEIADQLPIDKPAAHKIVRSLVRRGVCRISHLRGVRSIELLFRPGEQKPTPKGPKMPNAGIKNKVKLTPP